MRHLLSLEDSSWRIVVAATRPPSANLFSEAGIDRQRILFVSTDVSSWPDVAALFKAAWNWDNVKRIDLLIANAGTDDKESVYGLDMDLDAEEPEIPNLRCIEVNLLSIFYALKLFIFYARKCQREASRQGVPVSPPFNPKVVITGSCVGQYRFPVAPQYCAAKHGVVGLTRSVGGRLLRSDNIAVNCVMPGFVPTSLASADLIAAWPTEHTTPVTSTNRAFMELIDKAGFVQQDGRSDGECGVVKAGQTVEVVGDRLYYRREVDSPDQSMDFLRAQAEEGGLWETMYTNSQVDLSLVQPAGRLGLPVQELKTR